MQPPGTTRGSEEKLNQITTAIKNREFSPKTGWDCQYCDYTMLCERTGAWVSEGIAEKHPDSRAIKPFFRVFPFQKHTDHSQVIYAEESRIHMRAMASTIPFSSYTYPVITLLELVSVRDTHEFLHSFPVYM